VRRVYHRRRGIAALISFVRGVVAARPAAQAREMLQNNPQVTQIRTASPTG
jgi:HSP90 family molecular chaperone